jgi:hypothetical protein
VRSQPQSKLDARRAAAARARLVAQYRQALAGAGVQAAEETGV